MSKGLGYWQRMIFAVLRGKSQPVTFIELCGGRYRPSTTRSIRRALQRMIESGGIVTVGRGGRADPFRYAVNPVIMVMAGNPVPEWCTAPDDREAIAEGIARLSGDTATPSPPGT